MEWRGVGLVAGVGAIVALGFLTAGRGDATPPGKIGLRYMAWGNPQQLALEQRLVDDFNRQNPDLHVTLFKVPQSSYGNKMIVMLASRTAPDLMRVDHYNFPQLVRRDYFRPVDDLVAADPDFRKEDFFETAIEEGTYQGRFYGVNQLYGSILVYYNKDLVRAAGLEDPYVLWQRGEWTWDRFRAHAQAMTVRRADGRYASFGAAIPVFPTYLGTVYSFGGTIMDAGETRVTLAEGKGLDMFRFWHDLRYVHRAAPTPAQAANAAYTFESGKLGMQFDWMGMTPRFREAALGFDWDVVPVPAGPGGNVGPLKGNQLVMSKETRHPEAAWRFMKYMASEPVERVICIEKRRAFPTRKAIATSPDYLRSDLPPRNMGAFLHAVSTGRPFPITSRWNDWTGRFNSGVDRLWLGTSEDVEGAVRDAQARAERALAIQEGL